MSAGGTDVRRRRWPHALAALLVAGAVVAAYFLQPARLTALILGHASRTLHLDFRTTGPGTYALRPEPRLVLPGLSASTPGARAPFFRSDRVELALPWDTLRGRSSVVSRIVLQSPDLDLPALQRWLAARPPSTNAFRVPDLAHGMEIDDGTLRGTDWRIENFDLALPSLANGERVQFNASGNLLHDAIASRFDLSMTSTPVGIGNGLRINAASIALKSDGELPSLTATGSVLASNAFALDLNGTMQRVPPLFAGFVDSAFMRTGDTPFSIVVSDGLPATTTAAATAPMPAQHGLRLKMTLGDPRRQPTFILNGETSNKQPMKARLHGQLSRWPDEWPELPPQMASITAPIAFDASYQGSFLLNAPIEYAVNRSSTSLQGQFRITDVRAWVKKKLIALLPSIEATFGAPQIGIGSTLLRGPGIDAHDDAVPPAQPIPRPSVVPKS
jgi:hypothetical protein